MMIQPSDEQFFTQTAEVAYYTCVTVTAICVIVLGYLLVRVIANLAWILEHLRGKNDGE